MPSDIGAAAFRRALLIATGAFGVVVMTGALLVPLGAISHLRGMVSQMCVTLSHITSDLASLTLITLAGATAVATMVTVLATVLLQRRALAGWRPVVGDARRRASSVARRHGIRSQVVVFENVGVIACSRGVANPSIWISERAVNALSDDELAAVLAHEHHHCTRRDPAKRQALEVLARALFLFPVVAAAARAFHRAAEFAADDAAAAMTSGRTTAKALLRFASTPALPAVVQFGASTTIGERVQRLLGQHEQRDDLDRRPQYVSVAMTLLALTCIAIVALLPTDM